MTSEPLIGPVELGPDDDGLAALLSRLPDLPHFRLLAHARTAFEPRLTYGQALMHDLSIPDRLQESVILRVAGWVGCDYVRVQHAAQGRRRGLTEVEIEAATAGEPGGMTDPAEREAVDFVGKMLDGRGASPGAVTALVAHIGERGLIEVGLVVERYLGLSLLLKSLGVPAADAVELVDVDEGVEVD